MAGNQKTNLEEVNMPKYYIIQGVSKRLLKVWVSITSIFYGAEDLKFCTNKLQNYTI